VTRLVTDFFVPLALNTDRLPDSVEGMFFRNLMKEWPQGLWIVTPDGKTLAHHYHQPQPEESYRASRDRWLAETREMIETVLKSNPELEKRKHVGSNALADRGIGFANDQSVRVAVSVAGYQRNRREGSPAVDSFRLTRTDWVTLTAADDRTEWSVPEEIAAKFAPALSPLTDLIFVPKPENVQKADLQAKIIRQTEDVAIVQYLGFWEAKHYRDGDPRFPIHAKAKGDGIGVFDLKSKTPREFVFILRGDYDNVGTQWDTAAVLEWRVSK
jgi:hypothetical protein